MVIQNITGGYTTMEERIYSRQDGRFETQVKDSQGTWWRNHLDSVTTTEGVILQIIQEENLLEVTVPEGKTRRISFKEFEKAQEHPIIVGDYMICNEEWAVVIKKCA